MGAEGASPPARLESVDAGLAKLAEMRDCVDSIAQDGAKFFDKGEFLLLFLLIVSIDLSTSATLGQPRPYELQTIVFIFFMTDGCLFVGSNIILGPLKKNYHTVYLCVFHVHVVPQGTRLRE